MKAKKILHTETIKGNTKSFFTAFKAFISRGNVVDMAIGVVIATAFSNIVTTFTSAFISPLISLLTSGANMSDMKWVIREEVLDEAGEVVSAEVSIAWGAFIQAIIDFLIISFVLFVVIRLFAKASEKAKSISLTQEQLEANEIAEQEKVIAEAKAKEEAEKQAKIEEEAKKKEQEKLDRFYENVEVIRQYLDKKQ